MNKFSLCFALILVFSCKSKSGIFLSGDTQMVMILIEFNQSTFEPFGILTKTITPSSIVIELDKDSVMLEENDWSLSCKLKEGNIMSFEYSEINYHLKGEFFLPKIYHAKSKVNFDPLSFQTTSIEIESFIQPVRYGEWIIEDNGITKKEKYDIEVILPPSWR